MDLQKRFENFIKEKNLFNRKDTVLLAVSGGVDSVVMTELFHRSKYKFAIAHCNFQLRGKDSDGDELFVKQLAKKYKVPLYSVRFNTKAFSRKNKLSIQEAARSLRYDWFAQLRLKGNLFPTATAHHLNDDIETFFINLLRGAGISGLQGMDHSKAVRPMLFASREEIETFAKKNKLKFRNDKSNESDVYLRNRIRHHLIPMMIELNPQFENVMRGNLSNLSLASKIFSNQVKEWNKEYRGSAEWEFDKAKISESDFPVEILFELIKEFGFNYSQAEQIIKSKASGRQFFNDEYRISTHRDKVIVELIEPADNSVYELQRDEKNFLSDNFILKVKLQDNPIKSEVAISGKPATHSLDVKKLNFPLSIRRWKSGDSFHPLGMKGKKKISDFLIDKKVSRPDKEKTYVLLSGKDIVCVLGHRIDERFKITDETKKIYCIEYITK